MSTEGLVRADAKRRGWDVLRTEREIGIVGVPCFVEPGHSGRCEIWVGVTRDSDQLQGGLEWQGPYDYVANVQGLRKGRVYDRAGAEIGNAIKSDEKSWCTLSMKRDVGEYEDAWQALRTYVNAIYAGFTTSDTQSTRRVERPYTFDIIGDKSRSEVEWLDLVAGERIAIVGLGGVGSWIADLVTKSDVYELHAWDDDVIEPRNIIRMPGAVDPQWLGKHKAEWFQQTYSSIHRRVRGSRVRVTKDNVQEVVTDTTFAFVAVDDDESRLMVCDAMFSARIPFVSVGLSLARRDTQATASVRVVTAHAHRESWRGAIPRVGQAGQDDYARLELPDISAMAAGWAIQSWRKMRGQIPQSQPEECMVYHAEDHSIVVRRPE